MLKFLWYFYTELKKSSLKKTLHGVSVRLNSIQFFINQSILADSKEIKTIGIWRSNSFIWVLLDCYIHLMLCKCFVLMHQKNLIFTNRIGLKEIGYIYIYIYIYIYNRRQKLRRQCFLFNNTLNFEAVFI